MALLRIEYVRPRHEGAAYGISTSVIQDVVRNSDGVVVAVEYVTVAGVSAMTAPAPAFEIIGGLSGGVFARVTCLAGAAVISEADAAPVVTDATGVRIEAGQPPIMLAIETNYRFAVIEALYAPTPLTVGGRSKVISVLLTLDVNAYVDGDVFFDTQIIANAVRTAGGTAILQSVTIIDRDDVGQALDLVLLDANVTLGTENQPPSITDANAGAILALGGPNNGLRFATSDYIDLGGSKVASKTGLGVVLEAAPTSKDIWIAGVIRGAGTFTAGGLTLKLGLLQD